MSFYFNIFCCGFGFMASLPAFGQVAQDTTALKPITVQAYFTKQPTLALPASAQTISQQAITQQQSSTLLPALNRVAGLRMEERSPGSYRVALRGSMIRSPFGVRNTKIYMADFPLTDAGGNTYLNLLDPLGIAEIAILKGPDGSLFGANSGGVIRITPKGFGETQDKAELLLTAGAYGLFQQQLSLQRRVSEQYQFSFNQSFLRSDGYRANSAMDKKTFQTAQHWQYAPDRSLRLFALYSDLGYQTPGGLTAEQMAADPRQARPAAGRNPGAAEQKAAIYNKTFYAGLAHDMQLSKNLLHSISVFGSTTDFTNPFISNYEVRDEENLGLRTYFSYAVDKAALSWQMQLGFEGQKGWSKIVNSDNDKGQPTALQAKDDLDNGQYTLFYRAMAKVYERWTLEGSLSLNGANVGYKQRFPELEQATGKIDFGAIWMPRLATSYLLSADFALRASVAKGYSPPTLAEVRSSDNKVNRGLEAEEGTNYELGARWESQNRRFVGDITAYRYRMSNGIIRQLDELGADYYLNAGDMDQDGIELTFFAHLIRPQPRGILRNLTYQLGLARQFYTFADYKVGDLDYGGNKLTAVPDWTLSNVLAAELTAGLSLNIFHNFVSSMPLNDANTVFAAKYHLLQAKLGLKLPLNKRLAMQLFVGADNLLNAKYSLGNDINAFGNRFFNPAAPRNFYGGLKLEI